MTNHQFKPLPTALHRLAAASAALCSVAAHAVITTSGAIGTTPGNAVIGPGSTNLPTVVLSIGQGSAGSLGVDGGSFLQLARVCLSAPRALAPARG